MLIRKKYRISVTYLPLACLSIFFLLPQITGSTELNKTAKAHLKLAEIALENSNFDEVIKFNTGLLISIFLMLYIPLDYVYKNTLRRSNNSK